MGARRRCSPVLIPLRITTSGLSICDSVDDQSWRTFYRLVGREGALGMDKSK